jgi:hypothetical protein
LEALEYCNVRGLELISLETLEEASMVWNHAPDLGKSIILTIVKKTHKSGETAFFYCLKHIFALALVIFQAKKIKFISQIKKFMFFIARFYK